MALHKISATFACIVAAAFAQHATAAVVIYNESINGDLPVTGSPLPNMALDVGTNTVTGRIGTSNGNGFDFDSFAFTVPAGTQLTSLSVTMLPGPENTAIGVANQWYLFAGSPNYEGGSLLENMYVLAPDTYTFTSTPLAANVYNLSAEGASYGGNPPAFGDYTFSLVVTSLASVPEPGTVIVWGLMFATVTSGIKLNRLFLSAGR